MIKPRILLTALLVCSSYWLNAQNVHGNVGTEASNSANAPKGGGGGQLTNVDLYTGTASINIPIHDFGVDGLNAGVSLGYTAKGIRVDEMSSSVGLGWQLNAGGSITREVNGLEDEISLPAYFKAGAVTYPTVDSGTWDWMEGKLAYNADAHANVEGYKFNKDDSEYDLFHVSMLGRSFSFAMKRNPYNHSEIFAFTKPHSNVKIEVATEFWNPSLTTLNYTTPGIPASRAGWNKHEGILRFTITDEKGNVFHFRRGDYQTKEYNVDSVYVFNNAKGIYYVTQKWNLVEVNTYSGQVITFEYDKAQVKYLENVTETFAQGASEEINYADTVVLYDPLEIKKHYWEGVKSHIKKINYPNDTKINFKIYNDTTAANTSRIDCRGDWLLDKIEVEQAFNNKNLRKLTFDLQHAYFNTPAYGETAIEIPYSNIRALAINGMTFPSTNQDSLKNVHMERGMRLMLKEIKRIGFDNTTTRNYYQFGYMDIPLPYRFSAHKDYYGYYNGKNSIPYIRNNFFWPATGYPRYDTFYLSIPYHFDPDDTYRYYNLYHGNYNPYWGLDRSFDSVNSQACVLNEITNNYGGKEILQYKNYTLTNPSCGYGYQLRVDCWNTGDTIGCDIDPLVEGKNVNDGLCIGSIVVNNGIDASHNSITEYIFTNGQRFYQGSYTSYINHPQGDTVRTNYFIAPHDYYSGSNHGFSDARVKRTSNFGTIILSDHRYKFSNLMYYDASYPYNSHMRSNLNKVSDIHYRTLPGHLDKHKMGLLLETTEHDKDGTEVTKQQSTYVEVYDTSAYAATKWVYSVRFFAGLCWGPAGVSFGHYIIDNKRMLLTKEKFTRKMNVLGGSSFADVTTQYNYFYDSLDNIILTTWSDSKGDSFKKYKRYNYNWPSNLASSAVNTLNNAKYQHLISQEYWKINGANDSTLVDVKLTPPAIVSGSIRFPMKFSLVNNETVSASAAGQLIGNGTTAIKLKNALNYENSSDYGTKILNDQEYTIMEASGDVLEHRLNDQEIYASTIYESNGRKSAAALNARHKDIAFTSFEVGTGRWFFDIADTVHIGASAITGSHAFNLVRNVNSIGSFFLDDMDYVLAFWAYSNTVPRVQLYHTGDTQFVSLQHQNTVGNWKLYTATISPDSADRIRITNVTMSSMLIDELRLHPAAATFETYTNVPMCGVGSKSDNSNYITYYEYDQLGRMVITRDMRGNILSKIEQFAQDPDNGSTSGSGGTPGGSGSY